MVKKIIICILGLSLLIFLIQAIASSNSGQDYTKGKITNCNKVWNQWYKSEHALIRAELNECLKNAITEEGRTACQNAYKQQHQELSRLRKEGKKECNECLKNTNNAFKEAREAAKENLRLCLSTASSKEAKKECKAQYKEEIRVEKRNRKNGRKECIKIEE